MIDKVEVITQPPLRYDADGDTAMIILHTSSVFKEYMGGIVGTEEMWGRENNFRYGGYGSILYNKKGLFASIAPSINFNGSGYVEKQKYREEKYIYKVHTPSSGLYNYKAIRGNLQYEFGDKDLIGLAFSTKKKKYDNNFDSEESTSFIGEAEKIVNNRNTYKSQEPHLTSTAYCEITFGEKENKAWTEMSYFNLSGDSTTDYTGYKSPFYIPFLQYRQESDVIHLDSMPTMTIPSTWTQIVSIYWRQE